MNQQERAQKKCQKIIFGYQHNYKKLLELAGLETMEDRRARMFENFTKKTHENPRYIHWFPLEDNVIKRNFTEGQFSID